MAVNRRRVLALIASKRDATVITLIHRQETMSLLGIPIARYIDIDDSQSVLQAIRERCREPRSDDDPIFGTTAYLPGFEPYNL